ncbi:MAG: iron ABC transporter permease [Deltaproteobacteria bacterium]|nr:iron ABC transporter permease [Deltaproteobacteria bacterium]
MGRRRRLPLAGLLVALLVGAGLLGLLVGPAPIPVSRTLGILLAQGGLTSAEAPPSEVVIVTRVRLPRVLLAAVVGASLALAGAVMQGVFRNPLADPGVLGVSAGGALGAVMAIYLGLGFAGFLTTPLMAFLGAAASCLAIVAMGVARRAFLLPTLLLAGMAVNALFASLISSTIIFTQSVETFREILFWLMGGLDSRSWAHLGVVAIPAGAGALATLAFARDLNVLTLDDDEARGLGVAPERTRIVLLLLASLITGLAVSISGIIGFVGLMVPHLLRLVVGPDHRTLLPACLLGGATFLILADVASRVVLQPVEIRVGITTSVLGAPFFLFLLWRQGGQRGSYL